MMRRFLIILALFASAMSGFAETKASRDTLKHEVRVGWGDQLFETLIWHNQPFPGNINEPGTEFYRNMSYKYSQHWFAEYQYRINKWLGVGGCFDGSGVTWKGRYYDLYGNFLREDDGHDFYNLCITGNVRFSYLYHEYVSLHSSLGIGLNINGGSETDMYGKKTQCAMAVDVVFIGITVGHGHWFGSAEFGGLFSLKGQNMVFMAGSKIIRASVGFRF